jgi:hypothetical protein
VRTQPPVIRQYKNSDITVRVHGLDGDQMLRVHVEHKSGAALIAPDCKREDGPLGPKLTTTGFDGTVFHFEVNELVRELKIEASAPSVILGGKTTIALARAEDFVPAAGALRVTGDEDTMPIKTD